VSLDAEAFHGSIALAPPITDFSAKKESRMSTAALQVSRAFPDPLLTIAAPVQSSFARREAARTAAIAPTRRICTVVAAQHRQWWTAPLKHLPAQNITVQPLNRGTAHGVLLSLLHVAACDPDANVT
jgi:mannose-1-phosphate guanylyltransferase